MERAKKKMSQERRNALCIMLEGVCNSLGNDILGMTTIVPLFFVSLGAGAGLVGMLNTIGNLSTALVPLLMGGVVAATKSKRLFSMRVNAVGRGIIVLLPLCIFSGMPGAGLQTVVFAVLAIFLVFQRVTGLTWNYLMATCVRAEDRPTLMGTLMALFGVIALLSSNLVRVIRGSAISVMTQYGIIFGLSAVLFAASVFCYLPLRESHPPGGPPPRPGLRQYAGQLRACFANRAFLRVISANFFAYVSVCLLPFAILFANDGFGLSVDQISWLIIFQTFGSILGGLAGGRVARAFGTKRTLVAMEALTLLIPGLCLLAPGLGVPFPALGVMMFVTGTIKTKNLLYQVAIMEVIDTSRTIYFTVCKDLVFLPLSAVAVAAGLVIERWSYVPVFIAQGAMGLLGLVFALGLPLVRFNRRADEPKPP